MGVARKRKSRNAAGRRGPVPKKYQRDPKKFKLGGRPRKRDVTKPDAEASVSKPATRGGVYYHEIWWGLRRIRARFPSEWPTIGTKIITCSKESNGGGFFASAAVTKVKPCRKRDSIHVAFDDGRKETMDLKTYHMLMCPIDELCDEHAGVTLSREQFLFWHQHEAQLLDSASAANLHQSIVEKYMRKSNKLKGKLPTQLRILELCCGSKSFANYLRMKFPQAVIITLDIIDVEHPTHVADVTKWNYRDYYPTGWFQIVWASPPCTEYSPAKTTGIRKLPSADKVVKACLDIIVVALGKKRNGTLNGVYFIENPFTMLRKRRFMQFLKNNMHVCSFCKYGTKFRKNTCVWSNVPDLDLDRCTQSNPCSGCVDGKHKCRAQGGRSADGTPGVAKKEAQRIPDDLVAQLVRKALPYI
jgi:hypothetical protein